MTIELFTLCDGAYNYNGKLTIVGSLTSINVNQLPAKVQMSVAIRMRVEAEESGSRQIKIRFINPDGTAIPTDIVANVDLSSSNEMSYINFAASIQGLPITQDGLFTVEILIDDKRKATYPFNIHKETEAS